MAADKKRVTILVDAKAFAPADQPNVFDFSGFQPSSTSSGNLQPRSNEVVDGENCTSYQVGRKSIVEGVAATDLLQLHRKSLAQLAVANSAQPDASGGCGVNADAFTGVTLSRRHRVSQTEYDAGRDATVAAQLESFSFGSAE